MQELKVTHKGVEYDLGKIIFPVIYRAVDEKKLRTYVDELPEKEKIAFNNVFQREGVSFKKQTVPFKEIMDALDSAGSEKRVDTHLSALRGIITPEHLVIPENLVKSYLQVLAQNFEVMNKNEQPEFYPFSTFGEYKYLSIFFGLHRMVVLDKLKEWKNELKQMFPTIEEKGVNALLRQGVPAKEIDDYSLNLAEAQRYKGSLKETVNEQLLKNTIESNLSQLSVADAAEIKSLLCKKTGYNVVNIKKMLVSPAFLSLLSEDAKRIVGIQNRGKSKNLLKIKEKLTDVTALKELEEMMIPAPGKKYICSLMDLARWIDEDNAKNLMVTLSNLKTGKKQVGWFTPEMVELCKILSGRGNRLGQKPKIFAKKN